jgi:hypothetical protein
MAEKSMNAFPGRMATGDQPVTTSSSGLEKLDKHLLVVMDEGEAAAASNQAATISIKKGCHL